MEHLDKNNDGAVSILEFLKGMKSFGAAYADKMTNAAAAEQEQEPEPEPAPEAAAEPVEERAPVAKGDVQDEGVADEEGGAREEGASVAGSTASNTKTGVSKVGSDAGASVVGGDS